MGFNPAQGGGGGGSGSYLPLAGGTMDDGANVVLGSTTGTKIGTATSQKLSFYNATPIAQGLAVAAPSGGATIDAQARTAITSIIGRLSASGGGVGLIA